MKHHCYGIRYSFLAIFLLAFFALPTQAKTGDKPNILVI